uniref:Uncharacterized protein n=1 Tax=Cajanus cajan TaxID=3821 RepID=A0A151TSM9_CAJCA|nr:hypothetical protein KK1_009268 [Cajanus cajan]
MDQLQVTFDLLAQKHSQPQGDSSSSALSQIVKEISIGFPHFDGHTLVLEWIFKPEKFFNYHRTPDAQRADIAAIHFEQEVVPWFQMLQHLSIVNSWVDLTSALESQFGPSSFDCPMEELFKLQQTGFVLDYYLKFMALANRSFGLLAEALLKCFLSGLHKKIQHDVVVQSPSSLLRVVSLAKLYEKRYNPPLKSQNSSYIKKYSPISTSYHSPTTHNKPPIKQSLPPLLPTPPLPPICLRLSILIIDELLQQLKLNLAKAQNYMKQQADCKRREFQFNVGDFALVKLQPYQQYSVALQQSHKLGMKYIGPFEVITCIGYVAYKLKLPDSGHIHPVFHISLLKKFHSDAFQQYLPLPFTTNEFGPTIQPLQVLDVRWEATIPSEATWEDIDEIHKSYPHFNLEDRVVFDGKGIVTCGQEQRVKKREILHDKSKDVELVNQGGHVVNNLENEDTRKIMRIKKMSVLLKSYMK